LFNQNVKIFVIPSKTNLTECYIIRNGEDLNDRISECFRRSTTETASNKKTKKTQLDPKPQLPPRLLKQRQQQAAGDGRVDENKQRGPSQKEIRLGDREDRERPREPPVMDRSNSYYSRGGGGLDERDWNQDRDRDRDRDHEPPYKTLRNNWQRAHPAFSKFMQFFFVKEEDENEIESADGEEVKLLQLSEVSSCCI
jgi:hypothetical protein